MTIRKWFPRLCHAGVLDDPRLRWQSSASAAGVLRTKMTLTRALPVDQSAGAENCFLDRGFRNPLQSAPVPEPRAAKA